MNSRKLINPVSLAQIKSIIGISASKNDKQIFIKYVAPYPAKVTYSLSFSKEEVQNTSNNKYVIVNKIQRKDSNYLFSENPRLSFAICLDWLEKNIGFEPIYKSNVHKEVQIADNVFIDKDVTIGKGSIIESGVSIHRNVSIGKNCYIKSNAVIGSSGFGFERNKNTHIKVPHIGGVDIRDNVVVGASTTIARGTIGLTRVYDGTKIDDQVHIAHNCEIGSDTIITAGATLGGSILVGNNVWIGLGASIHQKIKIGNNAIVGIGCNVFKDILDSETFAGYPAKKIPKI